VRRRHQHVQRRRDVLQSDQLRNASHRDHQRRQLLGTISLSPNPDAMSNASSDTLTMYLKHYVIGCGDLDVTFDIACFMCMQYFMFFY